MKPTRCALLLSLLWLGALPLSLYAQKGESPEAKPQDANGQEKGRPEPPPYHEIGDTRRLYEEIEIMRRILREDLQRATQPSGASRGFAFADFDRDGRLDVFLLGTQQSSSTPSAEPSQANSIDLTRALAGRPDLSNYFLEAVTASADGWKDLRRTQSGLPGVESIEGNYLPGYGIVFSAAIQAHVEPKAPRPTRPVSQPLTEWDRVRKELHGEKMDNPQPAAQAPKPTLTDVLLKALAENGHHFSDLAAAELVTVAVTVRHDLRCDLCHAATPGGRIKGNPYPDPEFKSPKGPHARSKGPVGGAKVDHGGQSVSGAKTGPEANKSGSAGGEKTGQADNRQGKSPEGNFLGEFRVTNELRAELHDFVSAEEAAQNNALLGDLHMKQGRYQEAREAYKRAFETYRNLLKQRPVTGDFGSGPTSEEMKKHLTAAELAAKLGQAYLAAGEDAQSQQAAREITNQLHELELAYQKLEQARNTQPAKQSRRPALASKLLVSAHKSDLDAVAAGRISFEEFRKRATVQRLSFADRDEPAGQAAQSPVTPRGE